MRAPRRRGVYPRLSRRGSATPIARAIARRHGGSDEGFTLVELLIVCVVTPLIVGGLAIGLLSVFSLQSSVSNRLGDTGDSQVVAANFQTDVQSAVRITTQSGLTSGIYVGGVNQCGPLSQTTLVGFEWDSSTSVPKAAGGTTTGYLDLVAYDDVPNGSTNNLVRYSCTDGPTNVPSSSTIVSYNVLAPCSPAAAPPFTGCQGWPTIYPGPVTTAGTDANLAHTNAWVKTRTVKRVEFALAEPNSTEAGGAYQYTLAGIPADYTAVEADGGTPAGPTSPAGCNFATPGTGQYASTMCLVDFSSLTGNNLLAAEQGCLEMSVALPGGSTLYFCIGITGSAIAPSTLPTWVNGFLGNSCSGASGGGCTNGTPFYTGIAGQPALYQTAPGLTTITFSNIAVVNQQGLTATGWEAVSADAESTDQSESITWTTPALTVNGNPEYPLTIMNNGESYDSTADPVGNACSTANTPADYAAGLTENSSLNQVVCAVPAGVSIGLKTGTAMVWAPAPPTLTVQMVGGGLEAIVFGLLLS
jgi:type II secretory pathway pseudopilin PulG